jgi:hypothetical protein
MFRLLAGIAKSVLGVATCSIALRLLVPFVKSLLGIAQFAALSRIAERSGLRNTWVHPVAEKFSSSTGLNEGYLEILILGILSFWLMSLVSALARSLSAALAKDDRPA